MKPLEKASETNKAIGIPVKIAIYIRTTSENVDYLHSEIKTLERLRIIRDLRLGKYDVLVGINLLREGLDIPAVLS